MLQFYINIIVNIDDSSMLHQCFIHVFNDSHIEANNVPSNKYQRFINETYIAKFCCSIADFKARKSTAYILDPLAVNGSFSFRSHDVFHVIFA